MLNDPHASERENVESCRTCRFYFATPKGNYGDCHRFPPNSAFNDRSQVRPENWCGEYLSDVVKIEHFKVLDAKDAKSQEK